MIAAGAGAAGVGAAGVAGVAAWRFEVSFGRCVGFPGLLQVGRGRKGRIGEN